MQSFIFERTEAVRTSRHFAHKSTNVTLYSTTIKKGYEFNYEDAWYSISDNYRVEMGTNDVTCTVVESEDENIIVGSRQTSSLKKYITMLYLFLSNDNS